MAMVDRAQQRRRGFSLVELLVVVAIIALLVAILVPSLSRVREHSRRTACASNLSSIGKIYAAYANENTDIIPLGYSSHTKQFNYVVNINDRYGSWSVYWGVLAPLYIGGYMNDGNVKAFYCPSNGFPGHTFNYRSSSDPGSNNPWPPIRGPYQPDGTRVKATTRVGYGCRPAFGIDYGDAGGLTQEPGAPSGVYLMKFPANPAKIHEMKNFAIFADIVSTPARVDGIHKVGVNALYGDGSARWVARKAFDANLSRIPNPDDGFRPDYNDEMLVDSNPNPARWTGVWADLDRN